MRPSFQIVLALMILAIAGVSFYFGLTGILEGVVEYPSKREAFQVVRASSPKMFWTCVLFWLGGSAGALWLAVVNLREATRRA